ncbi:hypothetical protein [Limnohabitans sp. B9-3]|uniref:hypothetical protein n=1 Tax=Limnohabitans sp. B9-3 TaxID=1100707 RepID=UPI000C1E4155|nr:hypothetical protein [Limnohabitans sp. B9-3]PIT78880.1 hypothetical protein B9Z42_01975 [Limnohabitans sp. B9-3]
MKTYFFPFLCVCLLVLGGCATPEYKAAYQTCSPGAFSQYPEDKVQTFEMRQRWVQVATGQLSCVAVQNAANVKQTVCTPITYMRPISTMEPVIVDRNEEPRKSLISACAQSMCIQRYGNVECKPTTPATSPVPVVGPMVTTPP